MHRVLIVDDDTELGRATRTASPASMVRASGAFT